MQEASFQEARLSKPTSKAGRIQRAVLDVLHEHEADGMLPTNGRFVFYELEQRGAVVKLAAGRRRASRSHGEEGLAGAQDVTDALILLREQALIPWSWIEDETRTLHGYDHPDSVAEILSEVVERAEINPWIEKPPLVLCESRSLAGVLRTIGVEYRCRVAATNGQCGGFLVTEIAPILEDGRAVLYLGDLEPDGPGDQIEANTRRVLEREHGDELDWTRIAINPEQAKGIEPVQKLDRRNRPHKRYDAWETEALGQRTVTELVREALDRLLPEPLEDVREREQAQRDECEERLDG